MSLLNNLDAPADGSGRINDGGAVGGQEEALEILRHAYGLHNGGNDAFASQQQQRHHEAQPLQQEQPRRRHSADALNTVEALLVADEGRNTAGEVCDGAVGGGHDQQQHQQQQPRRRHSDSALDAAERLLAAAGITPDDDYDHVGYENCKGSSNVHSGGARTHSDGMGIHGSGDAHGDVSAFSVTSPAQHQPQPRRNSRRRHSDSALTSAEALISAAGFDDTVEEYGHGVGGDHEPLPHRPVRRRCNSDGDAADKILAAAGLGPDDPYGPAEGGYYGSAVAGGEGGRRRIVAPAPPTRAPRRCNSDGGLGTAEALVAAAGVDAEQYGYGGGGACYDGGGMGYYGSAGFDQEQSRRLHKSSSMPIDAVPSVAAAPPPAANDGGYYGGAAAFLGASSMATAASRQQLHSLLSAMAASNASMPVAPNLLQHHHQQQYVLRHQSQMQHQTSDFEPTSIGDMMGMIASPEHAISASSSAFPSSNRCGSTGSFTAAQRRSSMGSNKEVTVVKAGNAAGAKKRSWKKPKDKPCRPLSAYNLFFRSEREKLIGAPSPGAEATPQKKEDEGGDGSAAPAPPRGRKQRKHRKTHGKIGFAALAQTIAAKWKVLDPGLKAPFEAQADIERARYRKELEEWKRVQRQKRLAEQRAEFREIKERQSQEGAGGAEAGEGGAEGADAEGTNRQDEQATSTTAEAREGGGGKGDASMSEQPTTSAMPMDLETDVVAPATEAVNSTPSSPSAMANAPPAGQGKGGDGAPSPTNANANTESLFGAMDDFWAKPLHDLPTITVGAGKGESTEATILLSDLADPHNSSFNDSGFVLDLGDSKNDLSSLGI